MQNAGPTSIFIAYSSKDLAYKEEIRKRLKPLLRAGKVTVWDNYDIEAGKDWDAEIREKLAHSDLILLLLSPDALDSDYFYEVEAPIALERHSIGEAVAVGILLRPCSFKHTPFEFGRYELLPKKGLPITEWGNPDEAYLSVFEEIDLLVEGKRREYETVLTTEIEKQNTSATVTTDWTAKENDPFYELMVPVKSGTFYMGDTAGDGDETEKPVHSVTVRDFYLCKYPVTQAQWKTIMGDNPSYFKGDDLPVDQVSWDDAQKFIKILNERTKKVYRLPTEAEWEFAARGGKVSKGFKYSGSNLLEEVAWFAENSDSKTHAVGQKKGNELGLYDMNGNVWELMEDDWHSNYRGAPTNGSAWLDGPRSKYKVIRGGMWSSYPTRCRIEDRYQGGSEHRFASFRLAM